MRVLQELGAGEVVQIVGIGEGLNELRGGLIRRWGMGGHVEYGDVGLGVARWSVVGLRVGRS